MRRAVHRLTLGVDWRAGLTTLCAPMTRRIALITTLLALALATPAAAQQNPFGPLPQAAPTETPTPAATPSSDDNNTGRATLFIIGGALVIGFALMGWFILRDARSAVPEEELAAMGRLREQGPHAHKQHAKRKARAKGRAQRNARKANRPR
jgi:hypothetical protein